MNQNRGETTTKKNCGSTTLKKCKLRSNYFRKFIPLLIVGAYLEQKEGLNIVTEWCEHKIKATFELGTLENLCLYRLLVWPPFGLIYEFLFFSLILIF